MSICPVCGANHHKDFKVLECLDAQEHFVALAIAMNNMDMAKREHLVFQDALSYAESKGISW